LKIAQKFLVFGLVPALAQAFICVQMFSLLNTVEYYNDREAKQIMIYRKLVAAMGKLVEMGVAARAYLNTPNDDLAHLVEKSSDGVDAIFEELRSLTSDDPATHADIEQLIKIGAGSQTQFLSFKESLGQTTASTSAITSENVEAFRSGRVFIGRMRQANKILDRETKQLEETGAKIKANREEVKKFIWAELFLSTGFIAVLYLLFRYDFAKRFSSLLEIARDLSMDVAPSKTISGADELSELSRALVAAAEARQEAVAQKQMLFQMVTHDLRSPLMAASLVVQTLLRQVTESAEQRQKRLESLEKSLLRVVGLTNDLLTVEQLSAGGLEITRVRVDFQETIDQAIETVQPLADQNKCRLINQSPSLLVSIDEDRILQVTVNLLANAIKFSPAGKEVAVTAAIENNWLRVEVMDRGPGINDKDIQRLFNPFQQGNDGQNSAGFGLGLAIAKMLVDLHGGNIGARSRPGGGTIFWYTLRI
jgi:signal transduction histidine kinase